MTHFDPDDWGDDDIEPSLPPVWLVVGGIISIALLLVTAIVLYF